jgi:uncharacterized membrane protein (UPF0127 family)
MSEARLAPRLRRLPRTVVAGRRVRVAVTVRDRLLGLSRLPLSLAGGGLLIPGCRSVHTFGMRFVLDVFFLGRDGAVLRAARRVPPRRILVCRAATAVLELPSQAGGERASRRS